MALLVLLRSRGGQTLLLKVKSHSGCLMNERADTLADRGTLLEDNEVFSGPAKYSSLHLRVKLPLRECTKDVFPRDSAPNKALLAAAVRINTIAAAKLRNTIFTRDLLLRGQGGAISRKIAHCRGTVVRCWMKAMTGTYPTASYLHRIGLAASSACPHCNTGQRETLTHFMCFCPKFREARTEGHNRAWNSVSAFLQKNLNSSWQYFKETPMGLTGLQLQPIPSINPADPPVRVEGLQPDGVAVSWRFKKIALLEFTRPSDVSPAQLKAASDRKITKYNTLLVALRCYTESGWQIEILPWVVGIRGLIINHGICSAAKFLDIPQQAWQAAIETTVIASVESLAFMHRVRYSPAAQSKQFDTNDPPGAQLGAINTQSSQKRHRHPYLHDNFQETRLKWTRMANNTQQRP